MNERRKAKRRHLIYYLKVYDTRTGAHIGNVVDLTTDGILIISDNPLDRDTLYSLKIDPPKTMDASGDITFTARSIQSRKDINGDYYVTGFEFQDINKYSESMIDDIIMNYAFPDSDIDKNI